MPRFRLGLCFAAPPVSPVRAQHNGDRLLRENFACATQRPPTTEGIHLTSIFSEDLFPRYISRSFFPLAASLSPSFVPTRAGYIRKHATSNISFVNQARPPGSREQVILRRPIVIEVTFQNNVTLQRGVKLGIVRTVADRRRYLILPRVRGRSREFASDYAMTYHFV